MDLKEAGVSGTQSIVQICQAAIGILVEVQQSQQHHHDQGVPSSSSSTTSHNCPVILHFLGAEELEIGHDLSPEGITTRYDELFERAHQLGIQEIAIRFFGPNLLSATRPDIPHEIEFSYLNILNVVIGRYCCLYHDHWAERHSTEDAPDIVLMINAGIWGYQSWLPTLDIFKQIARLPLHTADDCKTCSAGRNSSKSGTYFIVTSYTLEEAEDDEDTIRHHYKQEPLSYLQAVWLWEAEINPWRSTELLERESQVIGRKYYSNHAWQCWHFVPSAAALSDAKQ